MARHNRQGRGEDQNGNEYLIDYQPDWLHQVKVTRELPSGRQSTKTLFRNPDPAVRDPGRHVRTRISAPTLGLDIHVTLNDETSAVRRLTVEAVVSTGPEKGENVAFVLSRKRARGRTPSGS
jgi:hypothetical protein